MTFLFNNVASFEEKWETPGSSQDSYLNDFFHNSYPVAPMIIEKNSNKKRMITFIHKTTPSEITYPTYKKAVYVWHNSYLGTMNIYIIRKPILYGG
jgi:hypothetical protein